MKVILSIRGDTNDSNFESLQSLALESGFQVTMRPVNEQPLLVPTAHQGYQMRPRRRKGSLPNKEKATDFVIRFARDEKLRHVTTEWVTNLLMRYGLAPNTASATLSKLHAERRIDATEQKGIYRVLYPEDFQQ